MLPIPFFAFRTIYDEVARDDWLDTGPLPAFELVDQALVLSALAHPFVTLGDRDAYPSVPGKAAALFRGLVKNHGLRDGNKRLAVTVMSTFLLMNGWLPEYTNPQLYRYALKVARHEGNYQIGAIEKWIRRHSTLMPDRSLARVRRQNRNIHARGDLWGTAFEADERGWEEYVGARPTPQPRRRRPRPLPVSRSADNDNYPIRQDDPGPPR